MSFRRSTLEALGGFREYYTGISGVREDADSFFRARGLGLKAVFIYDAVANHVAAPQSRGRRFDSRYHHWANRNTAILMVANFGPSSHYYRRNAAALRRSNQGAVRGFVEPSGTLRA